MAEGYETERAKKRKYYNDNFKTLYNDGLGGSKQAHGETNSHRDKKYGHSMAYRNANHKIHQTSCHKSFRS